MAHDVFISYSAKNKTTGDAVCATLESNGIRCWIAPRDVVPGMEWSECIIEAIEQARIMVLVLTADANDSPQIRREVERAVNHGVAVLPLRVEDVLPGKALEYFIGNVHWLDALTPPLEAHLQNLAGTIKMLLARMEPRDAPSVPQTAVVAEAPQVAKPPEATMAPPAEPAVVPPATQWAEAAPQEPEMSGPAMELEAALQSAQSYLTEPVAAAAVPAPTVVEVSEHAESPTAETGPQLSGPQEASPEDHPEVSAAVPWKVRIRRVRTFAILGGAAALIVLAWLSVFLSREAPWVENFDVTTGLLNSIFGTSDGQRLWIVGSNGTILGSADGGGTWTARNSGTTEWLRSIFGTSDGQRLWAVGGDLYCKKLSTILESDDGGASWTARSSGTKENLYSIFGTSDGQRLWAVGGDFLGTKPGTILESDDGGASWTARKSGATNGLSSIFGTSDGKRLWAVGWNGTILRSGDGGATWTAPKGGASLGLGWSDFYSIFGTSDGKQLWVVSDNGTVVEQDSTMRSRIEAARRALTGTPWTLIRQIKRLWK